MSPANPEGMCNRVRMPPARKPATKKQHSLGLEHEMAPAYQTDEGWRLIDVNLFNDASQQGTWNRVPPGLHMMFPGWKPPKPAGKVPPNAFHPLTSTNVRFVDGVSLSPPSPTRLIADGHAKQHDEGCVLVADKIAEGVASRGWKGISVAVNIDTWMTLLVVSRGSMTPVSFNSAFRSACKDVYYVQADDPNAFELDSGFIEVKSYRHKNATIRSIASEVVKAEHRVVQRGEELAPRGHRVAILPRAQVTVDGVVTYAGSFHVWITLPHHEGPAFDHAEFVRAHSRLVCTMQHLEPLLLACMPMDPRAPGSGDDFSRASMRSRLNYLSGFAVASMPQLPSRRNVLCHESLAALNARHDPKVVSTSEVFEVTKKGAMVNVLACAEQERMADRNVMNWNAGSGTPHQAEGTDFRFSTCWDCGPDAAFYVGDSGKILTAHRVGEKWVPRKRCGSNMTGVEFRVFDHLDIDHEDLLGIVVLTAASAKAGKTPNQDPAWMTQMLRCARYGSRVPVSKEYWAKLRAAFGLKPSDLPSNAYEALNRLMEDAFAAHGRTSVAKKFDLLRAPRFPDVNFESWKAAIASRSHEYAAPFARVARDPKTLHKELGAGWGPDEYFIRHMVGS